jgi:hypothetical protein
MTGLFESIFGSQAAGSITNPVAQQQANSAFNAAYNQYQQSQLSNHGSGQLANNQLAQQYNMAQMQRYHPSMWAFNGKDMTVTEFADAVWPEDDPAKTMFLLKYTK